VFSHPQESVGMSVMHDTETTIASPV